MKITKGRRTRISTFGPTSWRRLEKNAATAGSYNEWNMKTFTMDEMWIFYNGWNVEKLF